LSLTASPKSWRSPAVQRPGFLYCADCMQFVCEAPASIDGNHDLRKTLTGFQLMTLGRSHSTNNSTMWFFVEPFRHSSSSILFI
jgi:hypothetical protein